MIPLPLSLLFIFSNIQAQTISRDADLGEGIITVGWYGFPPNNTIPNDPASISPVPNICGLIYYQKKDKILRKQQPDTSSDKARSATGTVDANAGSYQIVVPMKFIVPTCLIDWTKKKAYTFRKKSDTLQVEEKELQKENSEILYRLADNNKTIITSQEKDNPVFIAGKKCFKGTARDKTGENFTFYYSDATPKIHSPLNGFLPADFPYNVMRADATTDWSMGDGTVGKGKMIFQVLEIKECPLADSLFKIPDISQQNIH